MNLSKSNYKSNYVIDYAVHSEFCCGFLSCQLMDLVCSTSLKDFIEALSDMDQLQRISAATESFGEQLSGVHKCPREGSVRLKFCFRHGFLPRLPVTFFESLSAPWMS